MAAKQIRKKVVAAETESIEEQKPAVSAAEPAAEQVKPAPKAKKPRAKRLRRPRRSSPMLRVK